MNKRARFVFLVILITGLCGCSAAAVNAGSDATVKQAAVSGTVSAADGSALIAQVVITGESSLVRVNTDLLGRFSVVLPLGSYTFEITKGSEYERKTVQVEVLDRKAKYLGNYQLEKLYDTEWIAGDLHQHSVYSFDASDSPADILLSDISAGLGFGVITDHNEIRANAEFLSASPYGFVPMAGIEITTDRGHYNAFNYSSVVDIDVSNGAADIQRIIDEVRKDGDALLQINHPMRGEFAFEDWALAEEFDTMEVWNGKSMPPYVEGDANCLTKQKWYSMLNAGIYLPATAGSDNHDISGNKMFASDTYGSDDERYFMTSMYSGSPRTYVYAQPDAQSILAAICEGHSFLTNNPLAFLDVEGAIPGQSVPAGELHIHVLTESNRTLTHYAVIKNGEVLYEEDVSGMTAEHALAVSLETGDWVVLEVRGENGDYALTNPVFID